MFILLSVLNVQAQNDSITKINELDDQLINQQIELIAEQQQTEDGDVTNLTEQWNYFKKNPINLNKTNREELSALHIINDIQIHHLLDHIIKNGDLISIYELQSIEGFDLEIIKRLLPFVYVKDYANQTIYNINDVFKYGQQEVVYRFQRIIEKQAGYFTPDSATQINKPNSYYLGNPNRVFARYQFRYNNDVSFSLSGEKDAGEQFVKKQGFDFYSGHLSIRNRKFIKALVIGDYQATFGQGLTLWQGFAYGKSSSIINIKRNGSGINAYRSFDENRFFRGAAATLKFNKIELTALASYKNIDANIKTIDTTHGEDISITEISSLQQSGYHNTNALLQDKETIHQTILGGNAAYNNNSLHVGFTLQHMKLSSELKKTPALYNQFDFNGKTNTVGGIDYSYIFKNMNAFGEYAISANGGRSFCQGLVVALDQRLSFTALYRNFGRNFQNLYGNAISENTLPQNEKGLLIGMEARLFKSLTLTAYMDQYKFPWLQYQKSAPSTGRDVFAQLNYTPSKKIEMYARFRQRTKFENSSVNNLYDYLLPYTQYNYRYQISAQITNEVKLKMRIEYTQLFKTDQQEDGIVLFQDLTYKKPTSRFSFSVRYAIFDTKSYDSRLYLYESDVLYSYSVPALYYKGQRAYFMVNCDITKHIEVWIRLAQTIYDNQKTIYTGTLNQIDSNHKTEIKLQARLKF